MNITEEWFEENIEGFIELQEAAERTAERWLTATGRSRECIESLKIDETSIDIDTETSNCSCCGPDRDSHSIPISYIWDEGWLEKCEEAQAEEKRKAAEAAERNKKIREEAAAKKRKEDYFKLKKEFEGK